MVSGLFICINFEVMIDTHAHLYADAFDGEIDEVISRAKAAGVTKVLLPNIDTGSIVGLNTLVELDSTFFYRMMGLHPCSVDTDYEIQLERIKHELDTKETIAVGEIGIDLYWDKTKQEMQEKAFLIQCEWALEMNLPIAIHSRESTQLIIDLLKANFNGKLSGVFHCFVGTAEEAKEIVDMGYHIGIGGVVTFKNSDLRNHLFNTPLDRIIMETDSPYLAPVPYRGKRNESAYVKEVADELARIYSLSIDDISKITTANALELFKI